MATGCDVVVVGLGPGGESAAQQLAEAGLDVVAVERHLVGGECPYYGCIPSKMMVRAADLVAETGRAGKLAGDASIAPRWATVADRISELATTDWHDDAAADRLVDAGARLVRGEARLDGPGRVVVGEETFQARRGVVLNTGTSPARLPIEGLEGTPYWTNREAMRVTEVPVSLVVVGGGPIGCELAQVFARFGARVTVLEAGPRIMGPEEPESSELIASVFGEEGIEVRTGVSIDRVEHGGGFRVHVDGEVLESEQLLVAAGRSLNLRGIGLDTIGLDETARRVETDDRMRAGERLWAIGDITGHGAFTHMSMYQAAIAVADILGRHDAPRAEYHAVSRVTFTDPEVGSVGITEQQAREAGLSVRVATGELGSRGWLHGEAGTGLLKLVQDADTGALVGATSIGPAGGEVLGLLALAVHGRLPVASIRGMHFAFPTFHRALQPVLDQLG